MRTIHLISHTHWDREWYRTFQQFRLRLVHLVDNLLDILAAEPDYRHFMLDGQTIVLDDYLQMRPEAEPALRSYVRAGRLLIGPWHILPDMFLVSPEAHIRNLLAGDRESRRFGPKMAIGYMPDSFGHIGQMPQILRGFGIENACVWRGLDDQPTEFWWQSPDGSRVLVLYLRESYSNGASLNASIPAQFAEQLRQAADSLALYSPVPDLLIMYGTDHMEPSRGTGRAIELANEWFKDYRVVHSTLPAYLASVKAQIATNDVSLPAVVGELRSSGRAHLLPGVLSTRIWIKQRNQACEDLLEKWAEPFSTFASLVTQPHESGALLRQPSSIVRNTWRLLMECHPHDSICGCSVDQVHEEMRPRFDQVGQIGEEITKQSLETLADAVSTADPQLGANLQVAIVVFNPSSAPRTDVVTAKLSLPSGISDFEIIDAKGDVILHQTASGKVADLINVRVRRDGLGSLLAMVHEGRAGNLAIRDLRFERDDSVLHVEAIFAENAEPDVKIWEDGLQILHERLTDTTIEFFHIHARSPESAGITFVAPGVPGLGWKTFHVRSRDSRPPEVRVTPLVRLLAPLANSSLVQRLASLRSRRVARPPYIIENDLLRVQLDAGDGTLTVTDKATGRAYRGLNRFVDGGDCGDLYNFCPPANDSTQARPRLRGVSILGGPVQQRMTASLVLAVPASLNEDRKSRSKQTVDIPITTRVTLTCGVPRVDVHTRLDNRARDHRLRVHFPAPFAVQNACYDGHFEIVERPVGIPPHDSTWIEEPRPEVPQRAFTSITDDRARLTVANRGLPEVEVLPMADDPARSEMALTLLRCVGWLSRDDFPTRHGHAGPFLETPGAQMIGVWEFDYSILVSSDGISSFQQARDFQSPLRASVTGIHEGNLPSSGSFVQSGHPSFVITAVKAAEDRAGWIVRGFNVGDEAISVSLTPWRRFAVAERVNLAEESIESIPVGERGEIVVDVRGHEILTVMFSD